MKNDVINITMRCVPNHNNKPALSWNNLNQSKEDQAKFVDNLFQKNKLYSDYDTGFKIYYLSDYKSEKEGNPVDRAMEVLMKNLNISCCEEAIKAVKSSFKDVFGEERYKKIFGKNASIDLLKFAIDDKDNKNAKKVIEALDNGADFSVTDTRYTSFGWNALHWLAFHKDEEGLKKALSTLKLKNDTTTINQKTGAPWHILGANPGYQTALMLASKNGNRNDNIIKLLKENGADENAQDSSNNIYTSYFKK